MSVGVRLSAAGRGVTNASTSSRFIAALREHVQTGLTVCTWMFLWEMVSVLVFRPPEMQVSLTNASKSLVAYPAVEML
jgi:hypothetical protein